MRAGRTAMDGPRAGWMIVHMQLVLCEQHQRNERSVAAHRHQHTEWHFAVAGRCGFDLGPEQVEFAAGDLLIVPAQLPHRMCVRRSGEWIVQVVLATQAESDADQALLTAFAAKGPKLGVGNHRHAFFAGLSSDLAARDPFRRRGAGLRFTALLCDLVSGADSGSSPVVERALTLMRTRLTGRLSLSELATAAGCGRSLLARRFRAEVGEPPLAHFLGMRLDLGADLLRQGGKAVHQVAAACGFDDPYHFSRCFRRRFGRPPSAWGQQ
jgi:AraC-like DNA-binding protein/mannose-6-phosphate isomerase-like protein (cupin superfamily)